MTARRWRKSSYSGGTTGSDCVEVAALGAVIGVRDSKDLGSGHVTIDRTSFAVLVVQAKAGALDLR